MPNDISPKDAQLVCEMLLREPRDTAAREARGKLDAALHEFLMYSSAWPSLLLAAKEYQHLTAPAPDRTKLKGRQKKKQPAKKDFNL